MSWTSISKPSLPYYKWDASYPKWDFGKNWDSKGYPSITKPDAHITTNNYLLINDTDYLLINDAGDKLIISTETSSMYTNIPKPTL